MDSMNGNNGVDKVNQRGGGGGSGENEVTFARADEIDFKTFDVRMENQLTRAWSKESDPNVEKEKWEIDLVKLDIRSVIAPGHMARFTAACMMAKMQVLDWGEDDIASAAETAALRASFLQEVAVWHKLDHPNVSKFVGASMGTSNLKIPSSSTANNSHNPMPSGAFCVI